MRNLKLNKFKEWLVSKNLKETTVENYAYCFNEFMVFGTFTQETINKLLSKKGNMGNMRSFLSNLRKYLIINYKELEISQDLKLIIAEVDIPKLTGRAKERIIKPLLKEDIDILEKYLETEELKLKLLLSYHCGLRLGELLKITILSFNWEKWGKDKTKFGECTVYGKGDKEGIALVPPEIMVRMARFSRKKGIDSYSKKLFMSNQSGKIKHGGRIWQMKLRDAGIRSGITKLDENDKPIHGTAVHPHRLRHSYGYYLLNEKGLNIREIQELLRHSSIVSTQIYTYVDKEDLKEKLSKGNI